MTVRRRDLLNSNEWQLQVDGAASDLWLRVGTSTVNIDEEGRKSTTYSDGTFYLFDKERRRLYRARVRGFRSPEACHDAFDDEVIEEQPVGRRESLRQQKKARRMPRGMERTTL